LISKLAKNAIAKYRATITQKVMYPFNLKEKENKLKKICILNMLNIDEFIVSVKEL
jgi:hypothetical protein